MLKYVKMLKDISDKFNINASTQVVLPESLWDSLSTELVIGSNIRSITISELQNYRYSQTPLYWSGGNFYPHMYVRFTTAEDVTTLQYIWSTSGAFVNTCVYIENGTIYGKTDSSESFTLFENILPNTVYYVGIVQGANNTTHFVNSTNDGISWTDIGSVNGFDAINNLRFGIDTSEENEFKGTIDLTYVTVDEHHYGDIPAKQLIDTETGLIYGYTFSEPNNNAFLINHKLLSNTNDAGGNIAYLISVPFTDYYPENSECILNIHIRAQIHRYVSTTMELGNILCFISNERFSLYINGFRHFGNFSDFEYGDTFDITMKFQKDDSNLGNTIISATAKNLRTDEVQSVSEYDISGISSSYVFHFGPSFPQNSTGVSHDAAVTYDLSHCYVELVNAS